VCDPTDPVACDDGDPCTDDVCVGGTQCRNDPLTGIDGVTCACSVPLSSLCPEQPLPASIEKLADKACTLFDDAASAPPKRQRRKLLAGAQLLKKAIARAGRAMKTGALPANCGEVVVQRIGAARDHARQLAGML
jgi:hypothetical protein